MSHYYVKYDGDVIPNAGDFQYTKIINGLDTLTFTLPNHYVENYPTWKARVDEEIILYDSVDDSVQFKGTISRVQNSNPMQIYCVSSIDVLNRFTLPEESCNMVIDQVQLNANPTDGYAYYEGSGDWDTNNIYSTRDSQTFFDGHANVYCLNVGSGGGGGASYVQRTDISDATLVFEFYYAVQYAASSQFTIYVEDADGNDIARLHDDIGGGDAGDLMCTTSDGTTSIHELEDKTFIHIKIECTIDESPVPFSDTVTVYVNDVKQIDAETSISDNHAKVGKLRILNDSGITYVDAPAYDGDSGYTIGDNTDSIYGELECVTDDDEAPDPGWSTDAWTVDKEPPTYAIVSDATFTTESSSFNHSAAWVGNESSQDNDENDTDTENDTSFELRKGSADLVGYLPITINGETIPKTNYITSIAIDLQGVLGCAFGSVNTWVRMGIYWHKSNTFDESTAILLASVTSHAKSTYSLSYKTGPFGLSSQNNEWKLTKEDNDDELWFSKGAVNWEGGYLHFRTNAIGPLAQEMRLRIRYAEITVGYDTDDAETVNRKIYSTYSDTGKDYISLVNDDGDGMYNLLSSGFADGDTVYIGLSMNSAFTKCLTCTIPLDLPVLHINGGDEIDKGVAQDFGVSTGYDLFTQLCSLNNFIYFSSYSASSTVLYALQASDVDAATVTYSHSSDPPSSWDATTEPNEFGFVRIQYRNGVTPRIQADTPSSKLREYFEVRKDIITETAATEYGKLLANKMDALQESVQLSWTYKPTNIPVAGTKYNIALDRWNGSSFTTSTYSDYVCRMVTISQDGSSGGQWNIHAEFGLLSTKGQEWIGKKIATNSNTIRKEIQLSLNSANSSITRHPQLTAVTEGQHRTTAQVNTYADARITAAVAAGQTIDNAIDTLIATHTADDDAHHAKYTDAESVTAMGAKGDANALNHDRYTDAEAVTAMGAKADNNPLNHDQAGDNLPTAGNPSWYICCIQYVYLDDGRIEYFGEEWRNSGSVDGRVIYGVTLPLDLPDGKELHMDKIRFSLSDGDANNEIDRVIVYGHKETGYDTLLDDPGDYNTVNTNHDIDFTTDFAAATHKNIAISFFTNCASADALGFKYCLVRGWYEAP